MLIHFVFILYKCHGIGSFKTNIIFDVKSVDCEWGSWMLGECSKSCGGGIRNRSRIKIMEDLFGGKPCVGEKNVEEDCNLQVCPGNVYCHWL